MKNNNFYLESSRGTKLNILIIFAGIFLGFFCLAQTPPLSSDTIPPSAPTNLKTNTVCFTNITLFWTASTDNVAVTGYNIYRGGNKIATSSTTSFNDDGLSPSTTYSYTVAAYDAAGNISAQSNSVSATTKATLPPGNTSPKKGVGRAMGVGSTEELQALGVSWAYSWGIAPKQFDQNVYEHVPMINAGETRFDLIANVAKAHPGSYWLIFNEPDYIYQDNITPNEGAQEYHNLRSVIKGADPTAKLIVGGVFYTGTSDGSADMGWLRTFRSEYYNLYKVWPEVEGWHVHLYKGWSDYNKDIWRQTLMSVRDWMTYNGGTKELWLTEFGCLNSESMTKQIMVDQVAWLEQQLWLTRYAWYATCAGCGCSGCTGSLLASTEFVSCGGLTELGKLYATYGNPPVLDTTPPAAPTGVSVN